MAANIIRFFLLLLISLLVGTMFGIWVGFNPASLSAAAYVEQQQNAIRSLNTFLPALGAVCILLVVILAVLLKGAPSSRYLLVVAATCLITAGLVTRFANQPINSIVMTWSAQAPAANWMELRDAWWKWHIVRTVAGVAALVFTLLTVPGSRKNTA
jgi:uncharacterized membrane protein